VFTGESRNLIMRIPGLKKKKKSLTNDETRIFGVQDKTKNKTFWGKKKLILEGLNIRIYKILKFRRELLPL
jgi:hypothetical protein